MQTRIWLQPRLLVSLVLIAALFTPLVEPSARASERGAGTLEEKKYGKEVDLGVQTYSTTVINAVFGTEGSRQVAYATAAGENSVFNVIDVQGNELLHSVTMPGVRQVWRHVITPDGTVYIAGNSDSQTGELWKYTPASKTVEKVGTINGASSLWSMTTDPDGNVYIGTYPTGAVWKYDPGAGTFHDYGRMVAGQNYVRSLAYYKGFVYAGIGSVGDVIKLDVTTGAKTKISDEVPALLGVEAKDVPFAYNMAAVDGYLLVKFSGEHMKLLIYDLEKQEWTNTSIGKTGPDDVGVFNFTQLESRDGKVYVPANRTLYEIDLATLENRPTGISFRTSLRGSAWVDMNNPELPGESLVTITSAGRLTALNFTAGAVESRPSVVEGTPNPLHQLERGPDGNLYMSGYPGGTGARFDPRTETTTNFSLGQAEGMVELGTDMYLGLYPGGRIAKSDTTAPTTDVNEVFTLGEHQDRPYVMKASRGRLLIGSIPDYGMLGGALTIYDPESQEKRTYRNIVQDQSIVGLAERDGKIYGSTTIFGGLGIPPSQQRAKMFVWDVAGERRLQEFELDLPGLTDPPMISGLTFGPDGLLWGAVDGYVFALDPETLEVVKYKDIYPKVTNYGFWRPIYSRWSSEELLYINVANKLTVVDPETMKHQTLSDPSEEITFMTLARDANGRENLYFLGRSADANLRMIPISERGDVD